MNVFTLPTVRSQDARANLEAFIAKAKSSIAFGPVPWDDMVWPNVELRVKKRASTGRNGQSLNFTLQGGERGTKQQDPIPEPLGDFCKALVRLKEIERPTAIENHRVMIRAFRYLAQVMEDGADPCRLMPHHFDEAANRLRATLGPETAYGTGKALAEIARTLSTFNISRVQIDWANTIKRPHSHDRVTEEAAARRDAKMPSDAALDALPVIANMMDGVDHATVLRMRTTELLACGGWRINELMSIAEDCEVEKTDPDGTIHYGIKYVGEKGFGHTTKWIPSVMVDVARRAVADIRRITAPIREDARWMAENPNLVNIPELLHDLDRLLSIDELAAIMRSSAGKEPVARSVGVIPIDGMVRARDVLASLRTRSIEISAEKPVHHHMFLIRENMMHAQRGDIRASVRFLTSGMIGDFLTERQGRQSLFAKFGFTEPDGSPIKMTTHQFRHWLNTIAQEGGLSQELVARWSGRKDMSQNASYDHVSGAKLAERVRAVAERGGMMGPLTEVQERLPPVDRSAFLATSLATAHVTEIGLCVHDWSLLPCARHGDCTNCNEHLVDKGNETQAAEAKRQLAEVEQLLEKAAGEVADQTYGASRWEAAHRRRLEGLQAVVRIHEDPTIPDSTLVHTGAAAASTPLTLATKDGLLVS